MQLSLAGSRITFSACCVQTQQLRLSTWFILSVVPPSQVLALFLYSSHLCSFIFGAVQGIAAGRVTSWEDRFSSLYNPTSRPYNELKNPPLEPLFPLSFPHQQCKTQLEVLCSVVLGLVLRLEV